MGRKEVGCSSVAMKTKKRQAVVTVISARDIEKANKLSPSPRKMKTYAVVSATGQGQSTRTPLDTKGGTDPNWNFAMRLVLPERQLQAGKVVLTVTVFKKGRLSDRELGRATVPLADFLKKSGGTAEFSGYELHKPSSGEPNGTINISVKLDDQRYSPPPPSAYAAKGESVMAYLAYPAHPAPVFLAYPAAGTSAPTEYPAHPAPVSLAYPAAENPPPVGYSAHPAPVSLTYPAAGTSAPVGYPPHPAPVFLAYPAAGTPAPAGYPAHPAPVSLAYPAAGTPPPVGYPTHPAPVSLTYPAAGTSTPVGYPPHPASVFLTYPAAGTPAPAGYPAHPAPVSLAYPAAGTPPPAGYPAQWQGYSAPPREKKKFGLKLGNAMSLLHLGLFIGDLIGGNASYYDDSDA